MSDPEQVAYAVCFIKCYACVAGEHASPPVAHGWADDEDREHARSTGQPEPTGNCGCYCAREMDT